MTNGVLETIITILLGGGLLKGVESVYRAIMDGREKKRLFAVVGAKTPAEVESLSIATMASALSSAQDRIRNLVIERADDLKHYETKFKMLNDHVLVLEKKIDRLQNQNLKLIEFHFEKGGVKDDGEDSDSSDPI